MVVFTCNACSAVLKKNQVDKHCLKCRKCESLSCVDCGKDFWGNDYQNHNKCITEEEKYGGKAVVPKVCKGEVKQEQWVETVQNVIHKASTNPKLKGLLERLKDYPNIPRKKAKFENFLKNSLRFNSPALISEVWDILMANNNKEVKNPAAQDSKSNGNVSSITNGHGVAGNDESENNTLESSCPKSKREKKEERRKNAHKKEKKDKTVDSTEDVSDPKQSKKSKKRKRQESEQLNNNEDDENTEQAVSKKKKSKKKGVATEDLDTADDIETNGQEERTLNEPEEEAPPAKKKKVKFNWEKVIMAILEKKGEMNLKKLKKKVLSEFAAQDAANYNEENLSAKFDKKIVKTEGVKVSKDRASLKSAK